MKVSLVVETWNLGSARAAPDACEAILRKLLERLSAEETRPDEIVVTHDGLPAESCARLSTAVTPIPLGFVLVAAGADYYAHKNQGFAATTGRVVAFLDGDCTPCRGWLAALLAPLAAGDALVAAGPTAYPVGPAAPAATLIDFPLFASPLGPETVRNFFANNVAFVREIFAARLYPILPGLFHGQCQVLAMALQADGIAVRLVAGARLEHAWPEGARALLAMRLLRGADTRAMMPYFARAYAPRLERPLSRLGAAPALALLALRSLRTGAALLRAPRSAASLGIGGAVIAGTFVLDAIGALAPAVARALKGPAPPPQSRHPPGRSTRSGSPAP